MVHLGDTASFLRVVRIYVKKDELSLRIRKKSRRTWSTQGWWGEEERNSRWETRGVVWCVEYKISVLIRSHSLLGPGDLVRCTNAHLHMLPLDKHQERLN